MTKNRRVANQIRKWLLKNEIWQDVAIYFDGRVYSTSDKNEKHFYYNDAEHLFEFDGDPSRCFDNVNPSGINMSFEGPLCHILYYNTNYKLKRQFEKILEKNGLRYTFGDHWNIACWDREKE